MTPRTVSILGCGWMGLPLGAHLVRQGYRVKGSTTTPEKQAQIAEAGITPYLLRLEPDLAGPAVDDFFEADVLFLNVPPGRRAPDVEATFRARMEAVRAALAGAPVGLVLFASSTSVYPDLNRVVTEEDAGGDIRASGAVLLETERMLMQAPGFATTVLRFAGLYGYDRRPGRFLAGRREVANGAAPVNLVHRDDCIAIVAALLEQDVRGAVLNACADEHPSRRRFYTQAAAWLGLDPPQFVTEDAADAAASFKIVSNRRLKERLGYRFRHPDPMQPAP